MICEIYLIIIKKANILNIVRIGSWEKIIMKIHGFRKNQYAKRRYFPVVAILAAVATLILVLVIYTSRNLTLNRQRLEDSLLQEGLTLIRAVEAGNRTGMRMRWALNSLQILVEEIGKAPKVAYISVISPDGKILAHSQQDNIGQAADIEISSFKDESSALLTRTVSSEEGVDIFEITTKSAAPSLPEPGQSPMGMGTGMGMRRGMLEGSHEFADVAVIQLGMKMTDLKHMQQRDMRNALLMLVVLSVVGSAALYFIVFMQNYSAVNYAFQTMKSYTQHVVDSMVNGLISLDTEGKIVTMNRQAYHILDIPQQNQVEGKALGHVMTIQDIDISEVLATGERIIEQEIMCTTSSQATLPLSLSASTLTDDDGNHLGTVLLFRDLSDVKTLQEQIKRAERLASLGKLAAGIAHEIRNPLGALKGFLQYFQRKLSLQDQDKTYLTVMMKEVDRLNAVISNLLDFARPKDPVLEPCDIGSLIHHVLTLTKSDVQAKEIDLSLNIAEELPQVRLDRDQMTQVLLNILLNAIQVMEAGGQISIGAKIQSETNQLEIAISDNGKGISADDLPRIFDPFFTTKKRGAGLGLAIAHTIIENHHGEITVESEEGKGSTFRIRLPI
jgi:two-component system sensor histidine kinase HydH